MQVAIKGEWGSIGRAPKWVPSWLRQRLSWRKAGAFNIPFDPVDLNDGTEFILPGGWTATFVLLGDDVEVAVKKDGLTIWRTTHELKDLVLPFSVSFAGQFVKGSILFDF